MYVYCVGPPPFHLPLLLCGYFFFFLVPCQVYVMKRMGGVQDTCHTCRLLGMQHVKNICDYYRIRLPSILDMLGRNEMPPGRKGTVGRTSCLAKIELLVFETSTQLYLIALVAS